MITDKPVRHRSQKHLAWVRTHPCCIPGCRRGPIEAAHIRFAQPGAMGLKPSDFFCTPLCRQHHADQHRAGDERGWWASKRLDPLAIAERLWKIGPGPADVGEAI